MMKNIFNNKQGRLQKLILIILITLSIFLIPIGIYASENTTNVDDNSASEQPLEETVDDVVVEEAGHTPLQNPEVETSNETVEENPTSEEPPETNETVIEESSNETEVDFNETVVEKPAGGQGGEAPETPTLEVEILYPKEITRGKSITLISVITNTGNLEINHALVNWIVPSGFEIISTNQEDFDVLLPGDSFETDIHLETSSSTLQGINEIKLEVNY